MSTHVTNVSLDAYYISLLSNFAKTGTWQLSGSYLDSWQSNSTGFFQFQGQDISLYGREDTVGTGDVLVQSSYSINGTELGHHTSSSNDADNVLFFHTEGLPLGLHALTITVLQASNTSRYHLKTLEYNQTQIPPTTATQSHPASTSSESSGSTGSHGPPRSPTTGEIAGGAVGGGALLCALVALLSWWLRRRWTKRLGGEFAYGTKGQYDAMAEAPDTSLEAGQRDNSEDHGPLLTTGSPTARSVQVSGAEVASNLHQEIEELPQSSEELMEDDDDILPPYAP